MQNRATRLRSSWSIDKLHVQSVGVPSILPTDRRTLQTARGLAVRGLIVLQPLDMLALDGNEVFVVSLPGETLETHIEIL